MNSIQPMDLIFTTTSDDLKLPGIYYPAQASDLCILFIHGMSGFYLENYFGHVLGRRAQENEISYIFTHNRGYTHINDIRTTEKDNNGGFETKRCGAIYERFDGCVADIDSWLDKGRELGYKRFVIVGHSLGGPKVIHHFYKKHPPDVIGIILASPADMVGLIKRDLNLTNYSSILEEARHNVREGKSDKLLSEKIWNWYLLSSQTFLDLFEAGGPADVLPLSDNPEHFPELEVVNVPVLCVMSEHDDIAIRSLREDMELLKLKAVNAPAFETHLFPDTNHGYEGKEDEFSAKILNWVKEL